MVVAATHTKPTFAGFKIKVEKYFLTVQLQNYRFNVYYYMNAVKNFIQQITGL